MTTTIVPAKGELKETIKALLELADDPSQVRTVGHGGTLRVPDELADKYHQSLKPKRGRPRKDDTNEENPS